MSNTQVSRLGLAMVMNADNRPETLNRIISEVAMRDNKEFSEVQKALDFDTGTSLTAVQLNPLSGSNLDAIIREFNANGYLSRRNSQEMYSTIMKLAQPVNQLFTRVTTDELIYKVDVSAALGHRLVSRTRNPSMVDGYKDQLIAMLGFDIKVDQFELDTDITLELIINHMYQGTDAFINSVNAEISKLKANDISELMTKGLGTSASGNSNTDPDSAFLQLMRGYEHTLKYIDGNYTFSYETKVIRGAYEYLMAPNRINVKKINSTLSSWTGADTFTLLDEMYIATPKDKRDDPNMAYTMGSEMYFEYTQYRTAIGIDKDSYGFGVNTETREDAIQRGFVAMHRGKKIYIDRYLDHVRDGGSVVYGDLGEFMIVESSMKNIRDIKFNARSKGGIYEFTDMFHYGTGVRDKQKLTIAFSTYGANAVGTGVNNNDVVVPKLYAVDSKTSHLPSVLTGDVVKGSGAYLFNSMNPERIEIYYVAKGTVSKVSEIVAGTKVEPGFDISSLGAETYLAIAIDKLGLLDSLFADALEVKVVAS